MATFPENEVEVLREYVSDALSELMARMQAGLSGASITVNGTVSGPNADLVNQIRAQRAGLLRFLNHPSLNEARTKLQTIDEHFTHRNFSGGLDEVGRLDALPSVPRVIGFGNALRTTSVAFRESFTNPNGAEFSIPRTLPGYGGPIPTTAQQTQILGWSSFLSKDDERRLRVGLLRAEGHAGLRQFTAAIREYRKLLDDPDGLSPSQLKFLAIRTGMAHLASGDARFRSSRHLSGADRATARAAYRDAGIVLQQHDVSSSNPVHAQIADYARNRIDMLVGGINFLGLRDSFVPVHRHQFLLGLTQDHVALARDAVQKFVTYQSKADDLEAAEQQTAFELEIARIGVDIALDRQGIAGQQVERTRIQLDEISRQQGPFAVENFARVFEFAGRAASSPDAGPLAMGMGAAGMVFGHIARQKELEFQRRLAEVDQEIAKLEAEIAASEVDIANKRVQFLQDKLAFGGGRLDKDLYYALAQVYEQLAERQVEAAIRYAYLYERAIAFFLGKPAIAHVRFDYRTADGELSGLGADGRLITAADRLNEDVLKVTGELGNIAPVDVRHPFTEPPFSLAREFPIEFSRFLQTPAGQTARMDFVISFHQLSKRRPDCHQVRIIKVVVKLPSIAAAADFAGTLTHWGRFLLRDRQSTFDPDTVRLIPTPTQVDDALRQQEEAGTAQAAIGGIIPYALAHQPIPFGVPSDVTNQFTEFTLSAFEGYGPAGPWQLELRNVNVRNISDITLTFDLEAATDAVELEERVEPLIAAYEQELADDFVDGETLDRMQVFSLRKQFRDAFEDLETGTATYELGPQHFADQDFDGEDAKVRTVVAQALDPDGLGVEGVRLEIARQGTDFLLARTTGAGGFSEDLSQGRPPVQPPESRPPGVGTWQVRLPEPAQFDALDDLVLFFICDFR
jgi:hypothetical protein